MRTYAIGDIHGQFDLLRTAQDLVAADRAREGDFSAPLIHVGDLVDRGLKSAQVIDHLMQGQARGEPWHVLKGNHDRLFSMFLHDPWARDPNLRAERPWLHPRVGGGPTLMSYGIRAPEERPLADVHADALRMIPQAHVDWIAALPTQLTFGDAVFAHAGIRPGVALQDQTEDDLLWIRAEFLDDPRDHGALIVHGHSAIDAVTHYGNRLNMDSSAGYGGPVSAAVIEGRDAWLLTPEGRVPLR
ncbi:MAG: metallophosphoesterase [Paracoccaceae bacterium]|jgi:serine/threonine protein phosphatase 1|nr:metallophosphoesterase [Paracoccaceae bacterium]